MEYGYEITDTAGNKTFFVEGCTYCSMSTGGLHEQHCPLWKQQRLLVIREKSHRELGEAWQCLAGHKDYEAPYPKFVREQKALIDAHPEWGVKYL